MQKTTMPIGKHDFHQTESRRQADPGTNRNAHGDRRRSAPIHLGSTGHAAYLNG